MLDRQNFSNLVKSACGKGLISGRARAEGKEQNCLYSRKVGRAEGRGRDELRKQWGGDGLSVIANVWSAQLQVKLQFAAKGRKQ